MRARPSRRGRRSIGTTLALILCAQAALLALAGVAIVLDARARMADSIESRALEQNAFVARWLAETIEDLGVRDLAYESEGWTRVQTLVEHIQFPGETFACLLGPDGHILCHPDIRDEPALRGMGAGDKIMTLADRSRVPLGEADPDRVVTGLVSAKGQTYLVATTTIPSLGARVVLHQPRSGLAALGGQAMAGVVLRAGVAGVAVLGLTGLVTYRLVRRQSRTLEMINERLGGEIDDRVGHSLASRHALILGLAKLADCRDTDTGAHLERICLYCVTLAEALKGECDEIDDFWIENLRIAASLHDIGKVGIPDAVLLKSGKLTPEERSQIERHPLIGADTLIAIRERLGADDLIEMSLQICLSHHERWDGSGYPYALSGEQIPLAARLVALADVYDALTSPRVYKPAMGHEEASAIIREGRGTHFDPRVVDAFTRVRKDFDRTRASLQTDDDDTAWTMLHAA